MNYALDTNVLQALLQKDHIFQAKAIQIIQQYHSKAHFILSPVAYAEAFAIPNFVEEVFESFLQKLSIYVDLEPLGAGYWETVGQVHAEYHRRRKQHGITGQKRVLADFMIGAHAIERKAVLISFDPKIYKSFFRDLEVISN